MAYSKSFRPLVIRAFLRTGIICDKWLPLDGILFYQAMREAYGAQDATLPGGNITQGKKKARMPLALVRDGDPDWYYACSWAQWPQHAKEGTDYWNKRFDSRFADFVAFDGKRGKVIIEQGQYKAYHMPVFYRATLWIEWYAVGDKRRIVQLLSTVTNIGKKTVQGWGRVSAWEVAETEEDWSVWQEGRLMRGIPAKDLAGADGFDVSHVVDLMQYGYRPSYYRPENQTLIAVPHA